MKPNKLILRGFIPTKLNSGIEYLEFEPKQDLQLIIGDNGSGKSALLLALSPVPLDKKLFDSDGYREFHLEDNGIEYRLISDYTGKTPKHEFWEADVNLNQGGTGAVQTELVENKLRYTKFIHQILSTKTSFCQMSPRAREDLLVMISNLDMSYAYKTWDKVRELHRDTQAIIKHLNVKFADLSKSFDMLSDIESIEEDIVKINARLTELMPRSNFSLDPTVFSAVEDIQLRIKEQTDRGVEVMRSITQYAKKHDIASFGLAGPDHIEALKISMENDKITANEKIKRIKDILESQADLRQRLEEMPEDANVEMLSAKIASLDTQISNIRVSPADHDRDISDWEAHESELSVVKNKFLGYVDIMTENTGFTKETAEEVAKVYNELGEKVRALKKYSEDLQSTITNMSNLLDQALDCDNCGHKVHAVKGISEVKLEAAKKKKEEVDNKLIEIKPLFEKAKEDHEKLLEFQLCMKGVRDILANHPLTRYVFIKFKNTFEICSNPVAFITTLDSAILRAQRMTELSALLKEKKQTEGYLETLKITTSEQNTSFDELERQLSETYDSFTRMTNEQKILENYGKLVKELFDAKETINRLHSEYIEISIAFIKDTATKEYNQETRKLQTMLSELNRKLAEHKNIKQAIDEMANEMEEMKQRLAAATMLLKALSPKTGFIGKQLLMVCSSFVNAVNKIIGSIWEKDVLLTPPELGRNITKFNVAINGRISPELAELSSGQQDVFDLAVSLVVMNQLNLNTFPLYLDEVGRTFDERHRDNLMVFIKNLVLSSKCSMIFIVSHYAEQHGGFSNVDVSVLDDSNITVNSPEVNQCLTLVN